MVILLGFGWKRSQFIFVEDGNMKAASTANRREPHVLTGRLGRRPIIGLPFQAQVVDHLMIQFRAATIRGQIVADHGAVRAGEKDPAL